MRSLWLGAGALVLATCSARAAPAQSPVADANNFDDAAAVALLERAATAARTTNFEGTLLYRSGNMMEVLHVTHRFKNGEQSEHVVTLTGAPRELLRVGNKLTCILPRDHRLSLRQPPVKNFLAHLQGPALARLAEWYRFVSIDADRVAGRECMGVEVNPKDDYRYGYRMWMDKITGVPLRVALVGADARVLEQVMYTQIAFPGEIPDSAFQPEFKPVEGYHVVQQTLASTDAGAPQAVTQRDSDAWRLSVVPPGFAVTLRDQRHMPDQLGVVDHLMVSDGLSSVSVFAARADAGQPGLVGLSHVGAVHAYGRLLDGYHITVVGEAPARTVKMIGDALEPAVQGATQPALAGSLAVSVAH